MAKQYKFISRVNADAQEYLVNEELINSTDDEINETISYAGAGSIIRVAGSDIVKEKDFDGSWKEV